MYIRWWCVLILSLTLAAAEPPGRYAVMLKDAPLGRRFAERDRAKIETAQASLRGRLAARGIPVTGSVQRVLNAVFVVATPAQAAALRALPGVAGVVRLPRIHRQLDKAVQLVNAPAAWDALGGAGNAGMGIKIAILDTGIDQNHPAFRDPSLAVPPGFPICPVQADCAFTNNKVIVARSYVAQLAAGTPPNPAQDSRPDDISPRDRVGHGTALGMVAAGETNTGPSATITGMAPKAWLGSYKIFGSPGINDFTSGDVVISALEDALSDGMDIAVMSLGSPAFSGPLDQGAICGNPPGQPCDAQAAAVENAVAAGMTVVTAAGNDGDSGVQFIPTLDTIDSPGTAPSAISVGAVTNGHEWFNAVRLGSGAPANLQSIDALFGDGPLPPAAITAPLVDVATLGNDGLACTALPGGSLTGSLALVRVAPDNSSCQFLDQVLNTQNAGALGVIFYARNAGQGLFPPYGLAATDIPSVMIASQPGLALKAFIDSNAGFAVTLDPSFTARNATPDIMADFSSRGPVIGTGAIKPDLAAVGTELYMATQSYDPNGEMYDASGYTVAQGTSFSTPMVAGGVALVKQKNPGFRPGQLKSAVVNTANQNVTTTSNAPAPPVSAGAGLLDAGAAVGTNVTLEPSNLSFGFLGPGQNSLPESIKLTITNTGSGSVTLALLFTNKTPDASTQLALDTAGFTLSAGQSRTVAVTLSGNTPAPGRYSGTLAVQGGAVNLHVPYLYVVGDGAPDNLMALSGDGGDCTVNQDIVDQAVVFKVIDQYGVGVPNVPVQFTVTQGGGQIKNADAQTDQNGLAGAEAVCGPNPGTQQFEGAAGGLTVDFTNTARLQPVVASGGAVNAASYDVGQGLAPGSYMALFGSSLSDDTKANRAARLPLSIDQVSVGFDAPGVSLPGALTFVSPGQVNVQIPWELLGKTSAQIKVDVEDSLGQVYTLPLSTYSPGIFEIGGVAAALDQNNAVIAAGNPARRGQSISLFVNGLGPVDNPPPTGQPAPSQPLVHTSATPTVSIGGRSAAVSFSGLAPGFSGLYQVNVTVPPDAPTGSQPVTVGIGGVTSKASALPVQ